MKQKISVEDILYHMQVKEKERDKGASAITFTYEQWTQETQKIKKQCSLYGPQVEYKTNKDHSYLKISFTNTNDLHQIIKILKQYETDYDNFIKEESRDNFPVLLLNIIPVFYHGKFYLTCVDLLMWRVIKTTDQDTSDLELLYSNESLYVYETTQLEEKSIDAQIRRELAAKEYIDLKAEEQKEYERQRNKVRDKKRRK